MKAHSQLIRVLVVDDHPILRDGLSAMINSAEGITLVGEAATGVDGVRLFAELRPDVAIMDLRLPDISGIEAIIRIRERFPEARIIVLTTYLGDVQAGRALKAGAFAFLLKETLRIDLIDTIRAVDEGKKRIALDVASELAEYAGGATLTVGEIEVLEQMAYGNTNKVIAARLGVGEDLVKEHLRNILATLGATDRTHAVAIAMRRGFLDM